MAERLSHPKSRRLRSRREFVRAQAASVRVQTPHFLLLLVPGPELDAPARLGVTVTRKVANAVGRNRARRLVREAFRLDPALLPHGIDLVVIVKKDAPTLGLADVQAEWHRVRGLLQKKARAVLESAAQAPKAAP